MKKFLICLVVWGIPVFTPFAVFAQSAAETGTLESCFKYYDYGKVKVNLVSDRASYKTGENAVISGTIQNLNSFPVRNAVLYAQLKRINTDNNFNQNGHYLIDRITFIKNFNLSASEYKQIKVNLGISEGYPSGEYQLQYFIFSDAGFNFAGRNFLEEDNAGTSNFSVQNPNGELIYFDPDSLSVNGVKRKIRGTLPVLPKQETGISVNLANIADEAADIKAEYYIFDYDDALGDSLIEKGEQILNKTNGYRLDVGFTPQASGAYVFQAVVRDPVKSMIKYRFAITGDEPMPLRMNDLGITNYPPSVEDRAFMCFHSAGDGETADYNVRLSVLNNRDEVVDTRSVTGKFSSDVMAISLPLEKLADPGRFKIRGELTSDEVKGKDRFVEITYSCSDFGDTVRDLNFGFNPLRPDILTVEGRDGCGKLGKVDGTLDQVRVLKEGQLVKEDYNRELASGAYKLGDLAPGDYLLQVKRGDQVKTLAISVPKKRNNLIYTVFTLIVLALGSYYFIFLRRRVKKTGKKR